MKLQMSNVVMETIILTHGKINHGGAKCRIPISFTLSAESRQQIGLSDSFPEELTNGGNLTVTMHATVISLKENTDQPRLDGISHTVDIQISLADNWKWKFEDASDESNATVRFYCALHTSELESVQLATDYYFGPAWADSTAELSYSEPGTGTAVSLSDGPLFKQDADDEGDDESESEDEEATDDSEDHAAAARAAVAEIPVEPTHSLGSQTTADRKKARLAESAKKAEMSGGKVKARDGKRQPQPAISETVN